MSVTKFYLPDLWILCLLRGVVSVPRWMMLLALATCVPGCGPDTAVRSTDIRRYVAPKEKTLSAEKITQAEKLAQASQQTTARGRSKQIDYTLPKNWTEVSGPSGMRLATLAIGDGANSQEISIIPAAGTIRSNVERWQKQLDEEASDEEIAELVDTAMAKAGSVDVQGQKATVVLLTQSVDDDDKDAESILGGMLPMDESNTLFVKFRGPAEIARKEQKKFIAFIASLRLLQNGAEQVD
jgi:hypothetical protein